MRKHPNILLEIINACCGTSYNYQKDKVIVTKFEVPRENISEKALKCDYIMIINDDYQYNLEINRKNYEGLYERNLAYIFKLHASRIKKGMNYQEIKKITSTQINLNNYKNNTEEFMIRQAIMNVGEHVQVATNVINIYQIDIVKSYNMIYNEGVKDILTLPKLVRWAAIFQATTIEELDYILGSDLLDMGMKEDFLRCVEKVSNNENVVDEVTLEENYDMMMAAFALSTAKKMGKEMAEKMSKEMVEQERKKTIQQTIQSMLKNNLSIDLISKVTSKTIDEIKEIEKDLKAS